MRKIDAVLLSALIIYDYSAQSLVNSDTISLGHSFVSNSITDNKLVNADLPFMPDFTDPDSVVRGAKKVSPDDFILESSKKTISFHELAKVNPSTAVIASQNINAENADVMINVTAPADVEIDAPETFTATTESVNLNESGYAGSVSNTEKINDQVSSTADLSTFDDDNDGVYDVEDKCPGVAGVARFEGCPVPDTDADGVNDEEDRCPLEKGSEGNFGCPLVEKENVVSEVVAETVAPAQNDGQFVFTVGFNKENKILSSEDFNIVLQITDILVRTPNAKIEIEGTNSSSLPQTPVALLNNYFKDLGVSEKQIIIKNSIETKQISADGNSKVVMKIKL